MFKRQYIGVWCTLTCWFPFFELSLFKVDVRSSLSLFQSISLTNTIISVFFCTSLHSYLFSLAFSFSFSFFFVLRCLLFFSFYSTLFPHLFTTNVRTFFVSEDQHGVVCQDIFCWLEKVKREYKERSKGANFYLHTSEITWYLIMDDKVFKRIQFSLLNDGGTKFGLIWTIILSSDIQDYCN